MSLEAQQTSLAHPTKEAVGPGDKLWAVIHKKKSCEGEITHVFRVHTGISISLAMVMKERSLVAGFHHVYCLEKDPHAANFPSQFYAAAFYH